MYKVLAPKSMQEKKSNMGLWICDGLDGGSANQ